MGIENRWQQCAQGLKTLGMSYGNALFLDIIEAGLFKALNGSADRREGDNKTDQTCSKCRQKGFPVPPQWCPRFGWMGYDIGN